MKILSYILSFSVFITSLTPLSSIGQTPADDPFSRCQPKPTSDVGAQTEKIKLLTSSIKETDEQIKQKEQELEKLKLDLEEANKKVQDTSSENKDSSVMDERQQLIDQIEIAEAELKNLRNTQSVYSADLKYATETLMAQKERDQQTNSTIEIFNLTTGDLDPSSLSGPIAESNLQVMAMATSAVNHLKCTPTALTDSSAYYIFQGAAAVYLTNNLSGIMDYESLAECVSKEALSPTEKQDAQYALIKRAKELFEEMEKHVDSVTHKTNNDLELFLKAEEYALKEWLAKNAAVATNYVAYLAAKKNMDDAWDWQMGVKATAITLSIWVGMGHFWHWKSMTAMWLWWGIDLWPKYLAAKDEFNEAKRKLRTSHQHTHIACNYRDALEWDLEKEMVQFEKYLAAKNAADNAAKEEEKNRQDALNNQQNDGAREESKEQSNYLILKPKKIISQYSALNLFIDKLMAQDQEVLENTTKKIQDAYVKSTSTEEMKGSMSTLGDSAGRIPPFEPGTPQGDQVVKDLESQYLAKKELYSIQKKELDKMYEHLNFLMNDFNKFASQYGDVAEGNPEIKCTYESPFPEYRRAASVSGWDWDSSPEGKKWAETWRTQGCTTDNKNTMEKKSNDINNYYSVIEPQEKIVTELEFQMDQAELDWLTALQINTEGKVKDPNNEELITNSKEAASYASFISKIKGEWKTSAIDVEKNNYILVNRESTWTLERLLNEHPEIKKIVPNRKAGLSDPYTRSVYSRYVVNLILKNIEMLTRAKSIAHGQAKAYEELLNEADRKLDVKAKAISQGKPDLKPTQTCLKTEGGKSSADPTCSCKAKGSCKTFSFPDAAMSGSSKDLSSGLITDYANETFSGGESSRIKGDEVKKNAAATQKSIDETTSIIMGQREEMNYKNTEIEDMSSALENSIRSDARRSAATALPTNSSIGRMAKIQTLKEKIEPTEKKVPTVATSKPRRTVAPKKAKKTESEIISIDETGFDIEEGLVEESINLDLKKGRIEGPKAKEAEKESVDIQREPGKSLWKMVSDRYQRSGFDRLLKKKKPRP